MVYGLWRAPWCAGLVSHHPPGSQRVGRKADVAMTPRVDPSVGRSGPHDLAVRAEVARLATRSHPPLPAATSVTTRTPLRSRRDGRNMHYFWFS